MAQARIFYQQDCDINVLKGKRVAIIGYGSQGHAHALNLKESGVDVVVGLYEGSKSWAKAEQQGLTVMTTSVRPLPIAYITVLIIIPENGLGSSSGRKASPISPNAENTCEPITHFR